MKTDSVVSVRFPVLVTLLFAYCALAQQPPPSPSAKSNASSTSMQTAQSAQEVPVIDGGLGPCTVELQVNDGLGKPLFGVKVDVHIVYGFMGMRKMDLEAQTNVNGRVKFTGLPEKVRNPPLEFKAVKDQLTGIATVNPASECQAKHDIVMEKLKPAETSSPTPQ